MIKRGAPGTTSSSMFFYWLALLSFLSLLNKARASALTTAIAPNERLCFYADVDKAGEKIGVTCSTTKLPMTGSLTFPSSFTLLYVRHIHTNFISVGSGLVKVQSGGSFDIDFDVKDPKDKVLLDGQRERQGDYVLTANIVGEYSFCFENDMSTLTEKLIDFDIMVESEPRREAPAKPGQISEQTTALEESIFRLNSMLMNIKRTQK